MTARKISELTALTTPASGDYLPIVDISEVAAANKNKRITIEELMRGAPNGTAAAPGIAFESDPNTGIYSPGADQIAISTNSLQRLAIDANGNINIDSGGVYYDAVNNRLAVGTASPTGTLQIQPANSNIPASALVVRQNNGADTSQNTFSIEIDPVNNVSRLISTGTTSPQMSFYTGASERARIDSSGRLLAGASGAISGAYGGTPRFQIAVPSANPYYAAGFFAYHNDTNPTVIQIAHSRSTSVGHTILQAGDAIGAVRFEGSDGTGFIESASIIAGVDDTPGTNIMPGRLVFSTTPAGGYTPLERMRILSGGGVCLNSTSLIDPATGSNDGFSVNTDGFTGISGNGFSPLNIRRRSSDGAIVGFRRDTTLVGTISVTTTATAYNTSSDYRLKENVTAVTDGITRLQQLKPSRFNFIADPTKTVDGFLAHEVQTVVPEAITGEKDAVDADGNPEYQGIDQSKIVPLVVAALQEAIGEIESLKARVAALESA